MTIYQQTNRLTLEANPYAHRFQVRDNGVLLYESIRYVDAENEYIRLGGVVVAPTSVSRSAAYRQEQRDRGNHGGFGLSRSGGRR